MRGQLHAVGADETRARCAEPDAACFDEVPGQERVHLHLGQRHGRGGASPARQFEELLLSPRSVRRAGDRRLGSIRPGEGPAGGPDCSPDCERRHRQRDDRRQATLGPHDRHPIIEPDNTAG